MKRTSIDAPQSNTRNHPACIVPIETSKTREYPGPPLRLDPSLLTEFHPTDIEDGFVTVRCTIDVLVSCRIRIWKSTYLIDKSTGSRSKLLQAYNIPFYPEWKVLSDFSTMRFTLFFEPLPDSCEEFDLIEDIPESDGFHVEGIFRNKKDVYDVQFDCL